MSINSICCTFRDNWDNVSSTQAGLADCRSGDVRPVNHSLHAVEGNGDHHPVLMENAAQII